jgi:hypothetical protein
MLEHQGIWDSSRKAETGAQKEPAEAAKEA